MEIECFVLRCFAPTPAPRIGAPNSISNHINGGFKVSAKTSFHQDEGHNPLFHPAVSRASLRFREALRPEPLFVDPYAGCFLPPDEQLDQKLDRNQHNYCIATRFIDDKLHSVTKGLDGAKQVVLLTDGMDTRAYRLNWPSSTIIYDVSPQAVFKKAFQKLQDVGAKTPRGCFLVHVPLESSDLQQVLRDKGFNGNRPSIWVFQGLPVANLGSFGDVLFMVSCLATKGGLFLGELPVWLNKTEMGIKWMDEVFVRYGFRVRILRYDDVAKDLGQHHVQGDDDDHLLFVAEHLRFSDDQMERWRGEFQRLEEEGDEEGFEEL